MLGTDELFEYINKFQIDLDPRFNGILGRSVFPVRVSMLELVRFLWHRMMITRQYFRWFFVQF